MKKPSEPTSAEVVKFAQVLSEATNVASVELSPVERELLRNFRTADDRAQQDVAAMLEDMAIHFPRMRRRLSLVPGGRE